MILDNIPKQQAELVIVWLSYETSGDGNRSL